MPDLRIDPSTSSPFLARLPRAQVRIGGLLREDAQCTALAWGSGAEPGWAQIEFARAQFDARLAAPHARVEIAIDPHGVIWRGAIVAREAQLVGVRYRALEASALLDGAIMWPSEFNELDALSQSVLAPATARAIAQRAADIWAQWNTIVEGAVADVAIDVASFPEEVPPATNIVGLGLLAALQAVLASLDARWRLRCDHAVGLSTIVAVRLGDGAPRAIVRGTDPARPFFSQPHGRANVETMVRTSDASQIASHVLAEGDERVIERAVELEPDWNLVPDDFEPPEGHSIEEYVTQSQMRDVLDHWERYTLPRLDAGRLGDVENPHYRAKYERVARWWRIPPQDDRWQFDDDPTAALLGEASRQLPIESELVQTLDGHALQPFVVYQREGDDTYYVQWDGFAIRDDRYVEFARPFAEVVDLVAASGTSGAYVEDSWNSETSEYDVGDPSLDLTALVSEADIEAGAWLLLGDVMNAYRITARSAQVVTVLGNLDGAGVSGERGSHWAVVLDERDPRVRVGQGGMGGASGLYDIGDGATEWTDEHAGYYLVLGDFDPISLATLDAPGSLRVYRIARSSERYYQLDTTDDLFNAPASWTVLAPRTERRRPFTYVALNAAFRSAQRLQLFAGGFAAEPVVREVYKRNPAFRWRTERGNFRLVRDEETPDIVRAQPHAGPQDAVKETAALATWAAMEIAGSRTARIAYDATLRPWDLSLRIGDRLIDNGLDTGAAIVAIELDLREASQRIRAEGV